MTIPVDWQTAHRRQVASQRRASHLSNAGAHPSAGWQVPAARTGGRTARGCTPSQRPEQAPTAVATNRPQGCVPWGRFVPQAQDPPAPTMTPSLLLWTHEHGFSLHLAPGKVLPRHSEHLSRALTHLYSKIQHSSSATVVPCLPQYSVVIIAVNVWRLRRTF